MNDALIECIYTDSEELLRESYSKVRDKGKIELGYCLMIFSVCVFALAIWIKQVNWIAIAVVLLGGGIYSLRLPSIKARHVFEKIKEINHGTVPSATIVVTDKITHYYKLDTVVLLCENLRFAYFLKKAIVLVGEEGYLTFDRAGFTKGSPEELEKFIQEKCPQVTIIHKE